MKDKFLEAIEKPLYQNSTDDGGGMHIRFEKIHVVQDQAAEACEQIADDFAIRFAEWMDMHATQTSPRKWTFSHEKFPRRIKPYITAELLAIFKSQS